MSPLGVIECFYGRPWPEQERQSYAAFLNSLEFDFYIYAPKGDGALRKDWRLPFTAERMAGYRRLRDHFVGHGLQFGMALSPHALYGDFDQAQRRALLEKTKALSDLGLDYLGLFFDDMKSAPDLAQKQLEIVHCVQSVTHKTKLIFCPSFYSHDSLLDFLFGDRPNGYLEIVGRELDPAVEILWTGEQIISKEITAEHLQAIRRELRRPPFLCDNFYADDGPINCNFLRLLPPTGREASAFREASAWALNPMNQPNLSKFSLRAFAYATKGGLSPDQAFERAARESCAADTLGFLRGWFQKFAEVGLDQLTNEDRAELKRRLSATAGPVEAEILQWLDGEYAVGFDVIIDQSCYDGTPVG